MPTIYSYASSVSRTNKWVAVWRRGVWNFHNKELATAAIIFRGGNIFSHNWEIYFYTVVKHINLQISQGELYADPPAKLYILAVCYCNKSCTLQLYSLQVRMRVIQTHILIQNGTQILIPIQIQIKCNKGRKLQLDSLQVKTWVIYSNGFQYPIIDHLPWHPNITTANILVSVSCMERVETLFWIYSVGNPSKKCFIPPF